MSLEEHAQFLESLDGKKRDTEMLEKLMTPQGRLDYAIYRVITSPGAKGGHRYRALFDDEYRKRTNPGLERLQELDEEFANLTDVYHKQALVYYFGATEEENLIIAMKIDRDDIQKDIIERLKNMGGGAPPKEDDYGLDLDNWMEN